MTSTGVNVLRWSALGAGVAYGLYRQSTITASDKLRENMNEYTRKQNLIKQAKDEFSRKNAPKDSTKSGAITDMSDPKFDLEAALLDAEKS